MALDEAPQPSPCRVELLTAFRDRERVKKAGATWDSAAKRWVVYAGHDLRTVKEVDFSFILLISALASPLDFELRCFVQWIPQQEARKLGLPVA